MRAICLPLKLTHPLRTDPQELQRQPRRPQ